MAEWTGSEDELEPLEVVPASPARPRVPTYSFVVGPLLPGAFDTLELEVPSLSGRDFAARRAWWSAFHLLGPQGYEPEDFQVWAVEDGAQVGPGGFTS